jgi:glycosyltransferase involved in cell wall biosynthesis
MLDQITPVILTFDEEPNVGRTLAALSWARDVVVVDSCSTDRTLEILHAHPRVRVFSRPFDQHADQWNHAVTQTAITTDWILALDADYVLTPELIEELRVLVPAPAVNGFRTRFRYCIDGRPLRGSVYPPVITLFRRGLGRYWQDGHTQRLVLEGRCVDLAHPIDHDDRKSLRRWLQSQIRYTELEVAKLASAPMSDLSWPDRLRRGILLAPPLVFLYALVMKGCILDGRAGLYYCIQRTTAELILSLYLLRTYTSGKDQAS